ncbi:hypothetical protein DPMN_127620 [Dreissena polymorpha]|uniref:Uncharacterized protein n=1 Tax=Dreissena polymorpha TaxID=45954 RepID=A0A9D4JWN4_DREPO|nr:hypothetical protein DPMN_127620 [Dreissena polymorpha]
MFIPIKCKTPLYKNYLFPKTIMEWNNLEEIGMELATLSLPIQIQIHNGLKNFKTQRPEIEPQPSNFEIMTEPDVNNWTAAVITARCRNVEQCITSSAVKRKEPPVEEVVSSDSDDSDIAESDKGIMCKLFYSPCTDTKLQYINIVKWVL